MSFKDIQQVSMQVVLCCMSLNYAKTVIVSKEFLNMTH